MYFKKEKQFIYFGENNKKIYTFNCNDQTFLGLRGLVLKAPPICLKSNDFIDNPLMNTLQSFVDFTTTTKTKLNFNKVESIVEATNLHIYFDSWCVQDVINFFDLSIKDIIQCINILKETNNINYIPLNTNFVQKIKTLLLAKKLNLPPTITNPDIVEGIEKNKDLTYYMYELQAMSDMGIYLGDCIKYFLEKCKILNKPIKEKGKSFCEYYIQIKKEYEAKKDEILQNKLKKCNNKLKFETNNYIIIIPTTIGEYKKEAVSQHNCVFNIYMEKVANKRTNVVFVRKKDNINQSYITCEVDNNYNIKQFLTKYNNICHNEEDLQFEKEYQNYLNTLKEL